MSVMLSGSLFPTWATAPSSLLDGVRPTESPIKAREICLSFSHSQPPEIRPRFESRSTKMRPLGCPQRKHRPTKRPPVGLGIRQRLD